MANGSEILRENKVGSRVGGVVYIYIYIGIEERVRGSVGTSLCLSFAPITSGLSR